MRLMMPCASGRRNRRGREAEAERREPGYAFAVFVEPGGEADRVGKAQSHHGARIVRRALREETAQAQRMRGIQSA